MNKSLIKKALAICVSMALLVSGLIAANVFSAGDTSFFNFEDGLHGWTGSARSSMGQQFGSAEISQYTAADETDPLVKAGTKSLKVDMTTYPVDEVDTKEDYAFRINITKDGTVNGVPLVAGQKFTFNFFFPTGSTLRMIQIGHTGTPNYISSTAGLTIVKGSWFSIVDYTVPGDRSLTEFYITLVGNAGINETAYIDSVTMAVPATPTVDPSIPVNLVAGMNGQGIRAVAGDSSNVSDLTFGSEGTMPLTRLTNGNQTDHIDIYGGLNDVDHPGVRYDLGAVYSLSEVNFFGATGDTITPLGVDIYASTSSGDLFAEGNRIYTTTDNNVAKKGLVLTSAKSARYVAFLMTQKGDVGGYRPAEFEVFGEQSITVPNILAGNAGQGFRAVQGDIANISDLTFGSEGTMPLTRLTNENQTDHIDIYGGLNEADDPGVHYDLGAVYTLTEINFFGATGSTITPLGADIYASETYEDLFTAGNRVLSVSSDNNAKKGITFTSPINARYVAFIMTDVAELGGYRPAEFEVFGVPQGSPLPTAAPTAVPTAAPTAVPTAVPTLPASSNILLGVLGQGIRAVSGDTANVADVTFYTADSLPNMTDGNLTNHMDLYGGLNDEDRAGIRFDLGADHDITEVYFYGINSAEYTPLGLSVYASQSLDTLFDVSNRVYTTTDNSETKKGAALDSPKRARYIAYLFIQKSSDNQYRPAECEAIGTLVDSGTPTAEPTAVPTAVPSTDDSDFNFEAGIHGFTTQAATATYGVCAISTDTSKAYLGSQSLKVTKDAAEVKKAYRFYMNNASSLVKGDTYTFRVFIPTNSPLNHIEIWSDTSVSNTTYYNNLTKGSWITLTYVIPETSALWNMFINFMYGSNDPTGVEVIAYVDSIQVNSVAATPTAVPTAAPTTPPEPTTPAPANRVLGNPGESVRAVEGITSNVQPVTFGSEAQGHPISKMTDGELTHFDVWGGLGDSDYPGIYYDMGAEYDLTEVNFFGIDSAGYTPRGVSIYASQTYETLFNEENRLYTTYDNTDTKKGTVLSTAKRARYVGFLVTQRSADSQYRFAEFQAFGVTPGDPIPTAAPTAVPTATPTTAPTAVPTQAPIPTPVAGTDEAFFNFETDVQGWYVQNDITSNPAYGQGTVATDSDLVYAGSNSLKIGFNGGVGRKVYRVQLPTTGFEAGDIFTFKVYIPYGSRVQMLDIYTYNPTTNRQITDISQQQWVEIEYQVPLTVTTQPGQFWINVWLADGGEGFDYPSDSLYIDNVVKTGFVPSPTPDPYEVQNFVRGITPDGGRATAGNFEMWENVTFGSPSNLGLLTDGNTTTHFDVYGGFSDEGNGDRPGFLFTLPNYYDLQTVNVHVFDDDARALTISGVRVYASDDRATLFNSENLVYEVSGDLEPLKTLTLDTPKRIRYIALYLTETQSGWRPREFEAIGVLSEDQGELEGVEGPTNILLGMPPSSAGVAITSDYFSIINGGGTADYGTMLTDGFKSDQTVQLWGAKDRVGSKFVITYDLEQNYDISQIAAYVWPSADYQGVEAWDVYVSRYYDDLYNAENKYVGRRDFNDPAALKIPVVRETIRYISFVFTQPDYEVYGALRLFELEAFGVLSATQEVPVEEEPYDPYISIPHEETGVTLKVAKVDEFDDYAFAGTFNVTRSTASGDLAGLAGLLDLRYTGLMIFNFEILDEYGDPADFGGRTVKIVIDIPADFLGDEIYLAVLDGENTELMNASIVNGQFVFFTSNVQSYAIVRANAAGDPGIEIPDETETSDPGSSPETSEAGSLVVMLVAAIAAGSVTLFGMKKNYLKQ